MDHHERILRSGEKAGVGERLSHFLQETVVHSEPLKMSSNPSFQAPGLAEESSRCQKEDYHQQDGNDPGGNHPNQMMRAATGESYKKDRAGEQKCAAPLHSSGGWNWRTRRLLQPAQITKRKPGHARKSAARVQNFTNHEAVLPHRKDRSLLMAQK